jgi:hypothetical protein
MLPESPISPALYYSLLAFCLLLGLGLMGLAWRRPRTRQRTARMLASMAAAGALWLTAFPPVRHLPAARAEAILLTEGYSSDTLRQLLRQLGSGTAVWESDGVPSAVKARPLASLLTLAEQQPALHRLHVLGNGLAAAELPLLKNIPVRLHAGPQFTGIATVYWPARLKLGETFRIEGSVAAPTVNGKSGAWVILQADGAGRDSARISQTGAFRLKYRPKTSGLALYELRLRRPGQPVQAEPVPLEITVPTLPAVLLLTATPSFEFKFLKNYLAEAHYPVALRTSVSQGLVQTDFVNQPSLSLDRLTPALLARYAVVIADAATVAALSGAETQALQAAVSSGRLGFLTLAEAAPLPRTALAHADFVVQARPTLPAAAAPTAITWPDAPGDVRASLPAQLRVSAALRPLVTGAAGLWLAASRRIGLGRAVVSVVPETFRWGLQGHAPEYASFWAHLLAAAVPPAPVAASWRTSTRWPRLQQPLLLHLAGTLPTALPTVLPPNGGPAVRLALRQDSRLPEWSTAQFWPGTAGWHAVQGPGRVSHRFYAYPEGAWLGPELAERHQAAAAHNAALSKARSDAAAPFTVAEPWPAWWFFGMFLLAASYLWLEEKL